MGQPSRKVPADPEIEKAVVGDMLNLPDIVGEVSAMLTGADFYDRVCGTAFDIVVSHWRHGRTVSPVLLSRELDAAGRTPPPTWMADVLSAGWGAWRSHVEVIVDERMKRDALGVCAEGVTALRSPEGAAETISSMVQHLSRIESPIGHTPAGFSTIDDLLAAEDQAMDEWVVPGLLRRGWRVLVVAGEGGGKSTLLRQFAVASSQGLHPLGFTPMGHNCRVLLVDLENPTNLVRRSLRQMTRLVPDYEPGNVYVWSNPRGIDMNSRVGLSELTSAVAAAQPSLVLLGPAYKLYRRHNRQTDEEAVAEVQSTLDDLRTRYGFATMLEHHAPHGYAGSRDMRPVGTSLWLRWPELGFGMVAESKERPFPVNLQRWRHDRDREHAWPDKLDRGDQWPWAGVWPDATWQQASF